MCFTKTKNTEKCVFPYKLRASVTLTGKM